jgi:hypothetical protein
MWDQVRLGQRCQFDQADAVGKLCAAHLRDLQRQACLADPARTRERHQATRKQQLADFGDLPLAANEAGEANGQARGFLARGANPADGSPPLYERGFEPFQLGRRELKRPGQQRDGIAAGSEATSTLEQADRLAAESGTFGQCLLGQTSCQASPLEHLAERRAAVHALSRLVRLSPPRCRGGP